MPILQDSELEWVKDKVDKAVSKKKKDNIYFPSPTFLA